MRGCTFCNRPLTDLEAAENPLCAGCQVGHPTFALPPLPPRLFFRVSVPARALHGRPAAHLELRRRCPLVRQLTIDELQTRIRENAMLELGVMDGAAANDLAASVPGLALEIHRWASSIIGSDHLASDPFDRELVDLLKNDGRLRQLLIFDWYDGPIDGICQAMDSDLCVHFSSLAERWYGGTDRARLYGLRRVRDGALREVQAAHGLTPRPVAKIWIPPPYCIEEERLGVEAMVEEILATSTPTSVAIRSPDMSFILDIFLLKDEAP